MPSGFNASWKKQIEEAQAGNRDSYEKLLSELYPFLLSFVRKREPGDAEEILQKVFLKVHISLHTYRSEYPVEPWLYTIARNAMSDHRKERGYQRETQSIDDIQVAVEEPMLERMALERALLELPPDQKVAFELLKISGLSVETAAKQVGVSVSAFKVRAHRAYTSIKKALNSDTDD